jgi:hypothetical protein
VTSKWKTYEEVAAYLLDRHAAEFGLDHVEGKQTVVGKRSGTKWEIDAKGVREGNEGFVIIECRRRTRSKPNQEQLGALAYRIIDTGASGAIIVSPLDIQKGAAKVAAAENVLSVQLDADCTPTQFAMRFLTKLMVGIEFGVMVGVRMSGEALRTCRDCGERFHALEDEKVCPKCQTHTKQP